MYLSATIFIILSQIFAASTEEITLKLVDGGLYEGNVLVRRGSEWGLVCDDEWDIEDGNVICRQLGLGKAVGVTKYNKYGSSLTDYKIFLDDVKCQGHEHNLGSCMHREWMVSNCNTIEAAGVVCEGGSGEDDLDLKIVASHGGDQVEENSIDSSPQSVTASEVGRVEEPVARTRYSQRTLDILARARELLNNPSFLADRFPSDPVISEPESSSAVAVAAALPDDDAAAQPDHPAAAQPDHPAAALPDDDAAAQHDHGAAAQHGHHAAALEGRSGSFSVEDVNPAPVVPREVTADEVHQIEDVLTEMRAKSDQPLSPPAKPARVEVVGGRRSNEGYVRITMDDGKRGVVCSDTWGIYEAMVVCRQIGKHRAEKATLTDYYGARSLDKVIHEIHCDGHEKSLADCEYKLADRHGVACSKPVNVAGVVCTSAKLPDLMPNLWALQHSLRIEERPLHALTCAMEENCLSSSAYTARSYGSNSYSGSSYMFGAPSYGPTRKLLRFSSNIYNNGTADFRPKQHRSSWEWHSCHQHYHSMSAFSHYDILDSHGNRVAEGHKASFCLEDVECTWPRTKRYSCRGFSDQGISVGCADVYRSDIDCQWIDITDLQPGAFVFKLNVNPELEVPELSYDNNAAICELTYNGYSAKLSDCSLARG